MDCSSLFVLVELVDAHSCRVRDWVALTRV
jgi:hypothetical protein